METWVTLLVDALVVFSAMAFAAPFLLVVVSAAAALLAPALVLLATGASEDGLTAQFLAAALVLAAMSPACLGAALWLMKHGDRAAAVLLGGNSPRRA